VGVLKMNNRFLHRAVLALGVVLGIVSLAVLARSLQVGAVADRAIVSSAVAQAPAAAKPVAPKATLAAAAAQPPVGERPMPMFGGSPSRNMVNAYDQGAPTEWDVESKKNIKWSVPIGSRSYGGPIVADGKIFLGTNNQHPRNPRDEKKNAAGKLEPIDMGVLMCFDQATGKFLWQMVNDKLPSGRVHDWPKEGLCSTPTVEGDRVYVVTNRCEVNCLTVDGLGAGKNVGVTDEVHKGPTDADVVWRYDMIKELNVSPHNMSSSCPLILGDLLFVTTGNGVDEGHLNLPSPDAPSFLCLNKKTGKLVWRDNSPGRNVMHGQWSSPCYVVDAKGRKQVIFPGGDGWIHAFDPATGEHLWRFDANPKDSKYDLGGKGTRSDFIGTPVFYEGKIYIGVGQDPEHNEGVGHLWCIDPNGQGDVSPDLITDGTIFPPKTKPNPKSAAVWQFGGPTTPADRAKLKRGFYFGRTMSTCAINEGLLYACDLGGNFVCLDAKTGAYLWGHDLGAQVWGSPYWVDHKIYIGDDNGVVHIFKHGRTKTVIAENQLDETQIRSNPVFVDGVLYIMSVSNLYAIRSKIPAK
jgi:outer membrane protein assembly factor BamB